MTPRYALSLICAALLAMGAIACKDDKPAAPPDAPPTPTQQQPAGAPAEAPAANAQGGDVVDAEEGGKWVRSAPYNVQFRVPEDWVIKMEADGLSATDSDETTTVVLVGSESQGMIQSAVKDVQKKVNIRDATFQDSEQTVLSGFPAQTLRGTAVLDNEDGGQEIQFIAYNVQTGASQVVTMMIFSEAEMYEAKREMIEGIAKTLSKVKTN